MIDDDTENIDEYVDTPYIYDDSSIVSFVKDGARNSCNAKLFNLWRHKIFSHTQVACKNY